MSSPAHRFAAVDIGSNAVRLLISRAIRTDDDNILLKKEVWVRMPVRLGSEAFNLGIIRPATTETLIRTLLGYTGLIDAMAPLARRCVATSALRDAANSADICRAAAQRKAATIEIISGNEEAKLISNYYTQKKGDFLFADVGGGSTDIALVSGGQQQALKTFQIGTLRPAPAIAEQCRQLRDWLSDVQQRAKKLRVIASGGGINKIAALAAQDGKELTRHYLTSLLEKIQPMSEIQRIARYNLRPDRADTIEMTLNIFIQILTALDVNKLQARQYGLVDGIINSLYHQHINTCE